ncbi:uncharacterized protein LDX57_008713 [Aspergillus melleus]|uniref:uncharacterized protein n=1 Tax=Aspergillus melleus TaxID=138277 RepID=UPI001E8E268F|nr:uncharacterized protein LDX57_008713 [Aspergillus melleus]KAH8431052.1 hypothetical protein LDX57_008713 [Aspergillus melleus]
MPDHVNTAPSTDAEKHGFSGTNGKGAQERPLETTEDGAIGVNKAEAAALVWSKNALWAMYAWIWVCFFMLAFHSQIGLHVLVNAYANFQTAPEISTAAILATVVGGVMKLPIAKILNVWGRAEGMFIFTGLFILGIIVLASCTGPSGFAAGSGRTWIQSAMHYVHEFDVIGGLILMAAFILLLLPFSLTTYGRAEYKSATFIAMLVVGFCLFFGFFAWEKFFARKQFIRYDLLKQRTVLGACILSAICNMGYAIWDLYFLNFCMVVYDLSVSHGGYMNQIYNIGSCFWAPLLGIYIRQTKHFKNACLYFGLPLMLLGSGLMIHFRGEHDNIGYIVMCQIFIAFSGGTLVIGQDMAVMAAADHDGVPMMLSILGLFASLGGAAGNAISSAIYTNVFPNKLIDGLPASAQADWADIYLGGYLTQMEYPMGGQIRTAINDAWGDSQKYSCIATTAVLVLGFPCIMVWRNFSVDRKQNKGTML